MSSLLAGNDRELIHQLLDDLKVIEDQFPTTGLPKPSAIRAIFAPILRRWMVEQLFFHAQRLILPHQVDFPVRSSAKTRKLCKAGFYAHWMEVVEFGTLVISMSLPERKKYIGVDGRPTVDLGVPARTPVPQRAKDFFGQRMFYWKSSFYSRMDMLKLHANALGGVHFEYRRTATESQIKELKNYFGFELTERSTQMLIGEDIERGRADLQRRDRVYDATELITMDTARIFATGLRASSAEFVRRLGG